MRARVSKHNKVGQRMGSKGLETYRRIIDQTMMLLSDTPYMKVSAADVARACNLTPPALYLYFNGIPEIVLARLDEVMSLSHRYAAVLEEPWEGAQALPMAKEFVAAYTNFWKEFGVALRYRNFMSEQGDERFRTSRTKMLLPVIDNFAERIASRQRSGALPGDFEKFDAAAAIISLLDHVGSIVNTQFGKWHGQFLNVEGMVNATACMIVSLLEGSVPMNGAAVDVPGKRELVGSQI